MQQVVRVLSTVFPNYFGRVATRAFLQPRSLPVPNHWPDAFTGATQQQLAVVHSSIHYWQQGTGPCVLLVHGWERDHVAMGGFVEPLLAQGFSVAALDLPGHGVQAGQAALLPALAYAIARVSEAVGAVGVIAHSVGAAMTAKALESYGLRVNFCVLIASPSGAQLYAEQMARQQGIAQRARIQMIQGIEQKLGAPLSEYQVAQSLKKATCAQLIVHAEDDALIPASAAQANAAHPNAETFIIATGGHNKLLADQALIKRIIHWASCA